jgi:cell division protein FtsN
MSRLHLLVQAARHAFESEQAKRLAFIPPAEAHPQASAPSQPKTITLEPLSYVKKADGRVEATISLGERVQVVHEGEIFEVNFRVARISSSTVELVENSAPAAEPHLMAESGQGVAQTPAHKARQAPPRPTPEVVSNPGANRRFAVDLAASVSEPSVRQELGYVERADGRVEAIVADGEHVRLAPRTKSFANSFRAPAPTPADVEAANTLPPLINPLDSFGQESQPVKTSSSNQEAGVPPLVASGSEPSTVGKLQGIRGNNGESESEQFGIIQPEPLADYSGGRFEVKIPQAVAPTSPAVGPTIPSDGRGTQSVVNTLGYVEKAGGEKEAVVEVRGQVYLVHEGELFAEKYRALQLPSSPAAAQAMHVPPTAQVLQEILRFGAGGAIQGIFAVQVGAFRDRSNAERLKERIGSQFGPVTIQDFERGDGLLYRVRVGHASTEDAARALAQSLRKANLATGTFVVRSN